MLAPELERRLTGLVVGKQVAWRAPGLSVGIARGGSLEWTLGPGSFDVDHPEIAPDPATAFAIGSISKTFTAVMIMQLRDEGRLQLTDPVSSVIEGAPDVPLRELLAHASGLQRELPGNAWETMEVPTVAEAVAGIADAERVLPARLRWHYSNLAYTLLGEVVARLDGISWEQSLQTRLLGPLSLGATGLVPAAEHAVGYYADPYADRVHVEPWPPMGAFSAAGGLWSTVADLAAWGTCLARGADGVLSPATLEEMSRPEIMADLDAWTLAWGLGLMLHRSGEHLLVGHSGGMPGFSAGLAVDRASATVAVVLANSTAGADASGLAVELVCGVLDEDPAPKTPWRPGPAVPAEFEPLLGRWFSEGTAFAFSVRDGHLEARIEGQPPTKAPAVFAADGDLRYRTVSGRELGELLLVDPDHTRMRWAGYPFTREPRTFGPQAPVGP